MYYCRKNNKRSRVDSKSENGQAIVEMCVGLIGIMVIFLGVIFIAGLGISNVKIYLSAKNNAEYVSRNDSSFSGAGSAIYSWDYGADNLPFSADDQITGVPANDADTVFNSQITDSIYSEGEVDGSYSYMAINELPASVRNNFTGDLDSLFLTTADLVQSSSSYSESFYTLNSDIIGNSREIEQLKLNFGNLIHVEINQIDLQQMESNQVYMPNLAP
ncbi:MAG: hypothetical protein L3J71_14205 [Victivallaceae bacterium]|nr:hypothetical protein [Victivallaceae bacterium]